VRFDFFNKKEHWLTELTDKVVQWSLSRLVIQEYRIIWVKKVGRCSYAFGLLGLLENQLGRPAQERGDDNQFSQ
jgi:hypothetical protein